jgi:2-dehydro-3-deoxyphosphogluconate aldolase/(4S)-4-hydroxy-2-oxoglutarate aldolase
VVSPSLNSETARLCNRYQIPCIPGADTLKEVIEGMECGADIAKVFPGETLEPAFVRAVRGPMQEARSCRLEALALETLANGSRRAVWKSVWVEV